MIYDSDIIRDRVNMLLKKLNISQIQMLNDLGMNKNSLTSSNKKGISSFSLAQIADYLGVSVDYLLGRAESPILVATWDELYQMIDHMSEAQLDSLYRKIQDCLAEQQRQDGQDRR